MSTDDQYALNWNNHMTHVKNAFHSLLADKDLVDVTLSCEGKKLTAHKVVLSTCSSYFRDLFKDNPCQHPIIILKDVKYDVLSDVLKFVYSGEVTVKCDNLDLFLKTAELLQVSGLSDVEQLQKEKQTSACHVESNKAQSNSSSAKRKLDHSEHENKGSKKPTVEAVDAEYETQEVEFTCVKKEIMEYVREDTEDLDQDPLHTDYKLETVDHTTEFLDAQAQSKYILYITTFTAAMLNTNINSFFCFRFVTFTPNVLVILMLAFKLFCILYI